MPSRLLLNARFQTFYVLCRFNNIEIILSLIKKYASVNRFVMSNLQGEKRMNTDTELLSVLQANPKMALKLFKIIIETDFQVHVEEFKALSRRCDMCLTSKDSDIVYIIEFQAQMDKTIYLRGAIERALYHQNHLNKTVRLILCFLDPRDDPKTEPYASLAKDGNPFFQVVYLEALVKDLAREEPEHPLVSVFYPLFTKDETKLLQTAPAHLKNLAHSGLDNEQENVLIKVFSSWLLNRLPKLTKKELNAMLADLHPLEDTTFYKELLEKSRQEIRQEGRQEIRQEVQKGLLAKLLQQRFGTMPPWAKTRLDEAEPDQILGWLDRIFTGKTFEDILS